MITKSLITQLSTYVDEKSSLNNIKFLILLFKSQV